MLYNKEKQVPSNVKVKGGKMINSSTKKKGKPLQVIRRVES